MDEVKEDDRTCAWWFCVASDGNQYGNTIKLDTENPVMDWPTIAEVTFNNMEASISQLYMRDIHIMEIHLVIDSTLDEMNEARGLDV